MFPAGFWSRESVRRFALQLEGERCANACPPLTPRSRRARTNPLATDRPLAVFSMTFLSCLTSLSCSVVASARAAIRALVEEGACAETGPPAGCDWLGPEEGD